MARIAGVDLPRDKRIEYALPYIYGIGLTLSREILAKTGINPDTRVRDLTEAEIAKLREILDHEYKVEGDLRREESLNIKHNLFIKNFYRNTGRWINTDSLIFWTNIMFYFLIFRSKCLWLFWRNSDCKIRRCI